MRGRSYAFQFLLSGKQADNIAFCMSGHTGDEVQRKGIHNIIKADGFSSCISTNNFSPGRI